jgi:hypothetical protein
MSAVTAVVGAGMTLARHAIRCVPVLPRGVGRVSERAGQIAQAGCGAPARRQILRSYDSHTLSTGCTRSGWLTDALRTGEPQNEARTGGDFFSAL